ncbi:hypothetical protein OUZ56_030334 [Daphnia magna]|uniref:ZSWIM1/3 RNaseH-like domain-containing protein n=1 Tax=Daphnia magna TaxID=35525 RepID=A0ABQ9ZRG0_9CRUS|nr:hypothetical protein OUZ56_030334 [Daphnia magna]
MVAAISDSFYDFSVSFLMGRVYSLLHRQTVGARRDSIALDKEFATFEDIEKTIKELETVLCYPLHFGDAKTIVAYNKSDHIELYRRKQKLKENPAAYQFATSALAVGGNATLTRKEMSQTWGHFLKRKDLQNMKQAMTGLSSEVWQSTTEILANLTSNTENIVNVTSDEKGEIKCIYVQLSEQRRFYQRYGEVLQLDGTHSP